MFVQAIQRAPTSNKKRGMEQSLIASHHHLPWIYCHNFLGASLLSTTWYHSTDFCFPSLFHLTVVLQIFPNKTTQWASQPSPVPLNPVLPPLTSMLVKIPTSVASLPLVWRLGTLSLLDSEPSSVCSLLPWFILIGSSLGMPMLHLSISSEFACWFAHPDDVNVVDV